MCVCPVNDNHGRKFEQILYLTGLKEMSFPLENSVQCVLKITLEKKWKTYQSKVRVKRVK